MKLPDGLKHAVEIGANEVFVEWLDIVVEDPEAVIDGTDIGSTYQGALSAKDLSEADAKKLLADLAPWSRDGNAKTHAGVLEDLEARLLAAGIEFAHGLIALASDLDRVPERVKPFVGELTPLVEELEQAISDGSFDEGSYDLHGTIWS
jgi:hypothetical protein